MQQTFGFLFLSKKDFCEDGSPNHPDHVACRPDGSGDPSSHIDFGPGCRLLCRRLQKSRPSSVGSSPLPFGAGAGAHQSP
jgi:hypothetical protein